MRVLAALHPSGWIFARVIGFAVLVFVGAAQSYAQPKPTDPPATDSPAFKVPVLVSDFELYSIPPKPKIRNQQPPTPPEKPKLGSPLVYMEAEQPSDQARRFIDFFTMTLVRTLQKKGLSAIHSSGNNVQAGALLRGVFAEPDAENRIRRAILGAGTPSGGFLLYVGVFNLARDPKPLYRVADPQPSSSEYGPVITLNNYVPLVKYEIDKNPTEEEVQKICNQIASSLVSLLESNPDAFSH
jgi:Domain of unknown function (DUF4410)